MTTRTLSQYGIHLLASHEGSVRFPYLDSVGLPTIGIGHLCKNGDYYLKGRTVEQVKQIILSAKKNFLVKNEYTNGVKMSFWVPSCQQIKEELAITEEEMYNIYQQDLNRFCKGVNENVKVPLTDNQFAACVSLAYNIGLGVRGGTKGFLASSLLKYIEQRHYALIRMAFKKYVYAGGKISKGLQKRREEEADLFFSPDDIEHYPIQDRPKVIKSMESYLSYGALSTFQ